MAKSHRPEDELCAFAATTRFPELPPEVLHEAKRSLVNIFATAFAGCGEPAVEIALATMKPWSGRATASLVGRVELVDAPLAAFANAMAANIFDFDDTHEATIIHPAAVLLGALFAVAEERGATGEDLLRAFVIGGEVQCRIGNAATPGHYARGWHVTSTCGVFGAAAGVGVLLGLDRSRMREALATAAVQSSGLVEALGTMSKSVSVGNAARNGLLAAALAENGFTGPSAAFSGQRGWLRVVSDAPDFTVLLDGLGSEWEIAKNTYKPYPVGVVLNPVLDACAALTVEDGLKLSDVASVELTGHPLLAQRTDRPDVATGREAQVSAQHAIAISLLRGRAGLDEFDDDAVAETRSFGRPAVTFQNDPDRSIASVRMVVRTRHGQELSREIKASRGSQSNPLTDADLEEKFENLSKRVRMGANWDGRQLIDALWGLEKVDQAGSVMRFARKAGP